MENNNYNHNKKTRTLLVVSGAILMGLGIGLVLGQPGFGLIIGVGAGLLLCGFINR